tara:strand:- start:132 stop:842 length:711 start_codon:yes stop_codon:yes gene_type:complete
MNYCYSQQLGRNLLASRFSPLSLSPALWLDASDSSTLFNATTGGSLPADGQAIARWEDKSGNNRHVAQATGSHQPLRKTAIQNGKDVVRFDGANDRLDFSGISSASPWTLYAIYHKYGSFFALMGDDVSSAAINDFSNGAIYSSASDNTYVGCASPAGFNLVTVNKGATFKQYVNGSYSNNDSGSSPCGSTFSTLGLAGGNFSGGDLCELLFFQSSHSNTDRATVEAYLNAKWAIY